MEKIHSTIGASSAERWFNCPGSVKASKGRPNTESPAAAEGTAAHDLVDACLSQGREPHEFIGETFYNHVVTEEMADFCKVYTDYCSSLMKDADSFGIELGFNLEELHPGLFGTSDFYSYCDLAEKLTVIDFKYGAGIEVSPVENKQLLYYALGASIQPGIDTIKHVDIIIIQPRTNDADIKVWQTDKATLDQYRTDLIKAAKATRKANAEKYAGTWCRFCPASGNCETQYNQVQITASEDFATVPLPGQLTNDQIAKALLHKGTIKKFLEDLEVEAHARLKSGQILPGLKLVKKKKHRKWKSEKAAADKLLDVYEYEQIYTQKLKTPAQMEKIADKETVDMLLDKSGSNETSVVTDSDKRKAVGATAVEDFIDVPIQ